MYFAVHQINLPRLSIMYINPVNPFNFQRVNATTIRQGVNMTGLRVMVFARTVLVLQLVIHVTNAYHTIMRHHFQLTIQTDVKVSSKYITCFIFSFNTFKKAYRCFSMRFRHQFSTYAAM